MDSKFFGIVLLSALVLTVNSARDGRADDDFPSSREADHWESERQNVTKVLDRYFGLAYAALHEHNSLEDSLSYLRGGLEKVARLHPSWDNGPLTIRAVHHELAFLREIDRGAEGGEGSSELKIRTKRIFLIDAYNFIHWVSSELDRPYYIPYHYSRDHWDHDRRQTWESRYHDGFEKKYLVYAHWQMKTLLRALTVRTYYDDRRVVVAKGFTNAYIYSVAKAASMEYDDLNDSVLIHALGDIPDDFRRIGDDLKHHHYRNPVGDSFREATRLLRQLRERTEYATDREEIFSDDY